MEKFIQFRGKKFWPKKTFLYHLIIVNDKIECLRFVDFDSIEVAAALSWIYWAADNLLHF